MTPFENFRVARLSVFDDELLAAILWGGSLPTLGRILSVLRKFEEKASPFTAGMNPTQRISPASVK